MDNTGQPSPKRFRQDNEETNGVRSMVRSVIYSMLAAVEERLAIFRSDGGYHNGGLSTVWSSNGPGMPPNNDATLDNAYMVALSSSGCQNQVQVNAERHFDGDCRHSVNKEKNGIDNQETNKEVQIHQQTTPNISNTSTTANKGDSSPDAMDVFPKRIVMGLVVSPLHSLSNEAGQDALFEEGYDSDGEAPYFGDVELEKALLEAFDKYCHPDEAEVQKIPAPAPEEPATNQNSDFVLITDKEMKKNEERGAKG